MEAFIEKSSSRRTSPLYSVDVYICCKECKKTKESLLTIDASIGFFYCTECWLLWDNDTTDWCITESCNFEDIIQENEDSDETISIGTEEEAPNGYEFDNVGGADY